MRRLALLFFLCAVPAFAQRTIVSGTVTDSTGLAYSGAKLAVSLVAPVGSGGAYLNGAQIGTISPVTLDSNGSFLLNLPDNTLVQCANAQGQLVTCVPQTQWAFAVTLSPGIAPPLGTGPQTCNATLTISGVSQSVSSSFSACPPIAKVATSVAITPTINAVYASPSCPAAATNCFTVNNDGQVTTDGIYSAGSTTVGTQNTDVAFVGSGASGPEIGKAEFGTFNCPGTVSNCNDNCPQGTIQSVTDAHHVVVSIACTNTSSAGAHTNNWFWGHDDAAQLTAAFNVIINGSGTANNQRQNLFLPCGMMFMGAPSFVIPAGIRNTNGGISGCGGGGATVIVPLPRMNCNTAGGCLIADNTQPLENPGSNLAGWVFKDITFWGGGTDVKDPAATYSNPTAGIATSLFDSLVDVFVIGWVWNNATAVVGLQSNGSQWYQSGSVAGGTTSCQLAGSVGVPAAMFGGQCGGSVGATLGVALKIINPVFGGNENFAETNGVYVNQGGGLINASVANSVYWSKGDNITQTFINQSGTTFLTGTTINQFGSGQPALQMQGGIVHMTALTWLSQGTTFNISGGTIFDDCGVAVPNTGTAGTFTGGTVLGNCSISDIITNPTVTSRNASLSSQILVPAIRLPYTGPMNVKLYAFDVAPAGSGCTGNTTVVWTISYTDNTGTAQTQTATETITTNGGSTGGDKLATTFTFSTNGVTAISYSTTYTIGTGCTTGPSYAAQLAVT